MPDDRKLPLAYPDPSPTPFRVVEQPDEVLLGDRRIAHSLIKAVAVPIDDLLDLNAFVEALRAMGAKAANGPFLVGFVEGRAPP